MSHRINVMHALVKFHEYIPYSLGVMAQTWLRCMDTVYYMELSQGEIIQKPKMQELSSLFMTYRLIIHKVLELWPGHESGTYGRSNRQGHKKCQSCLPCS